MAFRSLDQKKIMYFKNGLAPVTYADALRELARKIEYKPQYINELSTVIGYLTGH